MVAVHLQGADAQRELRPHRVAQRAFRAAGEVVLLLHRLAVHLDRQGDVPPRGVEQFGVGLLVVPHVGVAAPVLVAVLLRAGVFLEDKQARFQALTGLGVAALQIHAEGLHQHRAVGEAPAGRGAGGRLRIGDVVETDLAGAGDGEEALLGGVIAPELGVDRVGDKAGCRDVVLGRGEDAGLGKLARELGALVLLVTLDELMDAAAGEIEEVDFAGRVLAEAHDAIGGAGKLFVASVLLKVLECDGLAHWRELFLSFDFLQALVVIAPHAAGVEIAVDVRLAEADLVERPEHLPKGPGVFEDQREAGRLAGLGGDDGAVPEADGIVARPVTDGQGIPQRQRVSDLR